MRQRKEINLCYGSLPPRHQSQSQLQLQNCCCFNENKPTPVASSSLSGSPSSSQLVGVDSHMWGQLFPWRNKQRFQFRWRRSTKVLSSSQTSGAARLGGCGLTGEEESDPIKTWQNTQIIQVCLFTCLYIFLCLNFNELMCVSISTLALLFWCLCCLLQQMQTSGPETTICRLQMCTWCPSLRLLLKKTDQKAVRTSANLLFSKPIYWSISHISYFSYRSVGFSPQKAAQTTRWIREHLVKPEQKTETPPAGVMRKWSDVHEERRAAQLRRLFSIIVPNLSWVGLFVEVSDSAFLWGGARSSLKCSHIWKDGNKLSWQVAD